MAQRRRAKGSRSSVPAWLAAAVLALWASINMLAVFVGWRFATRFRAHENANVQIQREVVDRLAMVGELLLVACEQARNGAEPAPARER